MKYGKGTIVFTTRTIFADSGKYDNRSGHPGMITIATDDVSDESYYLMLTSNLTKKIIYPDQYYDLSEVWEQIPLNKPSLINLETIYKGRITGDKLGGLWPQLYKDVIKELKEYQKDNPCENYEIIKDRI